MMCAIANDQGKQNGYHALWLRWQHLCAYRGMLLAEKGAQYDQVPVHVLKGEPRQPEHLARHPFGKVPVVEACSVGVRSRTNDQLILLSRTLPASEG